MLPPAQWSSLPFMLFTGGQTTAVGCASSTFTGDQSVQTEKPPPSHLMKSGSPVFDLAKQMDMKQLRLFQNSEIKMMRERGQ